MATKVHKGPAGSAKLFKNSDGKGAQSQLLERGQRATIVPGDTMSREMGQYGKGHSYLPDAADEGAMSPAAQQIRGIKGGIRKNPRSGGLANEMQRTPSTR